MSTRSQPDFMPRVFPRRKVVKQGRAAWIFDANALLAWLYDERLQLVDERSLVPIMGPIGIDNLICESSPDGWIYGVGSRPHESGTGGNFFSRVFRMRPNPTAEDDMEGSTILTMTSDVAAYHTEDPARGPTGVGTMPSAVGSMLVDAAGRVFFKMMHTDTKRVDLPQKGTEGGGYGYTRLASNPWALVDAGDVPLVDFAPAKAVVSGDQWSWQAYDQHRIWLVPCILGDGRWIGADRMPSGSSGNRGQENEWPSQPQASGLPHELPNSGGPFNRSHEDQAPAVYYWTPGWVSVWGNGWLERSSYTGAWTRISGSSNSLSTRFSWVVHAGGAQSFEEEGPYVSGLPSAHHGAREKDGPLPYVEARATYMGVTAAIRHQAIRKVVADKRYLYAWMQGYKPSLTDAGYAPGGIYRTPISAPGAAPQVWTRIITEPRYSDSPNTVWRDVTVSKHWIWIIELDTYGSTTGSVGVRRIVAFAKNGSKRIVLKELPGWGGSLQMTLSPSWEARWQ